MGKLISSLAFEWNGDEVQGVDDDEDMGGADGVGVDSPFEVEAVGGLGSRC